MGLPITATRMAAACRQFSGAAPFRDISPTALVLFSALFFPFILSYHRYPIPSFYQEWLAIFLALAAAILVATKSLGTQFELPFAAWIPLAMVPSVLLHLAVGNDLIAHGPPLYLIWIASAVLLMIIGRKLCSPGEAILLADVMAAAFVAGALLSTVAGWHWRFQTGIFDPLPWGQAGGWLGQRNQNALHIWLGVIGISHFMLNRKVSWFYFLVCVGILTETAIYTQSRSIYLYAGCGLVLGVWAAAKSTSRDTQKRLLLIGLLPVIFLGAIQGARWLLDRDLGGNSGAIQRYAPTTVAQDARLGLWLAASEITLANPWIGTGPGSFIRESWLLSDSLPATVPNAVPTAGAATHAHNLFLQIGAELGAPTALGMAGLLLAWFYYALRQTDWKRNWLYVALPVAILAHNQVEYSLWYLNFLVPTALAMGAATHQLAKPRVPALAVLFAAVLGFGLTVRLAQDYQTLENELRQAKTGARNIGRLLSATRNPVFGAWASKEIATGSWPTEMPFEVKNYHLGRALYVLPTNNTLLLRHADALERAGKPQAAAVETRILHRAFGETSTSQAPGAETLLP